MGVYPTNVYQTYQTKTVFVSSGAYDTDQTVSGSLRQLARVQGMDWSIPYPVEQIMYLDAGDEAYMSSHNPVNIDLSWLHTNGRNEQALGLLDIVGPGGALVPNLDQEKNLYVAIQNTLGVDAIGAPTGNVAQSVIAMGQALMTTYTMNAQVGGLVQSKATLNCLTAYSYTGSANNRVPAVRYSDGSQLTGQFVIPQSFSQYNPNATGYTDPTAASAIAARDMFLSFPQGTPFGIIFSGSQSCYLQGFDLTLAFDRRELKPLGYQYPPARAIFYPIRVDLSTEAVVNRYQRDQLDRFDCLGSGMQVALFVKQPCSTDVLFWFYFDKLQMESQSFSSSIGPTDTVSTKWKGIITTPSTIFCSPAVQQLVNVDTNSGWGATW